ncbi:MAG: hypothetical protein AB7O37_00890 [Vicinamibacteria bacterium]
MTTKKTRVALACLLLAAGGVGAQQPMLDPPKKEEAREGAPLQLQIVLSRYRGEQRISSLPYTLSLADDKDKARVRMGVQMPIRIGGEPEKVQYRDVGTNLDCWVKPLDAGRFRVTCHFEQSSVYAGTTPAGADSVVPSGTQPPSVPLFRSFRSEAALVLRDGQTGLHTSAADPVNGELLKAEVTLRLMK